MPAPLTLRPSQAHHLEGPPLELPTEAVLLCMLKLAIHPFNGNITASRDCHSIYLLEKPAAEAISGLTLTANNYEETILILKQRFGNKQHIITKHMDTLMQLSSQHNLKAFTQVRRLRFLGVESSSYGSLVIHGPSALATMFDGILEAIEAPLQDLLPLSNICDNFTTEGCHRCVIGGC